LARERTAIGMKKPVAGVLAQMNSSLATPDAMIEA